MATHRLGVNATIELEDAGSTARDLSGDANSITLNFTIETPEDTSFGMGARSRVGGGLQDWSIDFGGPWSDTATTGIDAVLGPLLPPANTTNIVTRVRVAPAGSTATYPAYTGSGVLSSYVPGVTVEGVASWTATIVGAGSITRAALAG